MGQVLFRCLLPCAWMAGLLLAGCNASVLQVRTESVSAPPPRSFWESFDHEAMAEKYSPILRRISKTAGSARLVVSSDCFFMSSSGRFALCHTNIARFPPRIASRWGRLRADV